MKRRPRDEEPPEDLLMFDGSAYPDPAEWRAAYARFCEARRIWAREHGIPESALPTERVGDEPWDPTLI